MHNATFPVFENTSRSACGLVRIPAMKKAIHTYEMERIGYPLPINPEPFALCQLCEWREVPPKKRKMDLRIKLVFLEMLGLGFGAVI